ncbi:efflux RND transporter periplasmic adaptor subunit [Hydrogenophaga sp.]|uniref:efflux RND transporter periplasmic adaptor subunit n=1 Tax=Hydrogenophaga sp. TaxID=1904254 RepID=UPI002718DBC2|nr:efflux RND transporter periplasmic adaptor subunit [Hydrogenophaga sp.]MDO8903903.1 efflux RND transporter periplasmic adaptor subunit [Hydrogenophaga sp.]
MSIPRKSASWFKWLLLGALVLALAFGLYRAIQKKQSQQATAIAAAQALQVAPVYELSANDVTEVASLKLTQTIMVSGSLQAIQTATVKARAAGELRDLTKREGDPVIAGEVLARIDSTEAEARVRQAARQADAAQTQVDIARRALDNNQALVRQGFISATALETSNANLRSAEATHQAAMAALDIARKGLSDTTLRSPLTGQVSARLAQNGERVGIDARILDVVDLSSFELAAAIAPADAVAVRVGQPATVQVEGLSEPLQATVLRINPSVQAGSRSVLVYLRVPAQPGMRQGLFAQGSISTGQLHALAVPLSAVRNDRPLPYVQVVQEGIVRHVTLQPGALGAMNGEPMRVVEGLPAGTVVLRAQAGLIREGTAVRAGTAETGAATAAPDGSIAPAAPTNVN